MKVTLGIYRGRYDDGVFVSSNPMSGEYFGFVKEIELDLGDVPAFDWKANAEKVKADKIKALEMQIAAMKGEAYE